LGLSAQAHHENLHLIPLCKQLRESKLDPNKKRKMSPVALLCCNGTHKHESYMENITTQPAEKAPLLCCSVLLLLPLLAGSAPNHCTQDSSIFPCTNQVFPIKSYTNHVFCSRQLFHYQRSVLFPVKISDISWTFHHTYFHAFCLIFKYAIKTRN